MERQVARRDARLGLWGPTPVTEVLVSLAMLSVPLMSYIQLAAPACSGLEHYLPANSRALAGYPCHGSTARLLFYLGRNLPSVLWDIFHLDGKDAWVTACLLCHLFRLASSIFLPPLLHRKIVAPATGYLLRASPFTFHLLQGSRFRPSSFALRILFRTLPAYDIGFFFSLLGIWRVNAVVELLYCCFTIAALAVLCYWYRDTVPGGVNLPLQIATRLLVCFVDLYSARAVQQQPYGRSGPAGSSTLGGNTAARASGKPTSAGLGADGGGGGVGEVVSASGQGGCSSSSGRGGAVRLPGQQPRDVASSASVPTSVCTTGRRLSDAATVFTEGPPGRDSDTAVVREPPAPPLAAATPTPATAAAAGAPATAAEATASQAPPAQPLLYRPFFERRAVGIKIPWAEPEQLPPDFRQRLRQLVEEKGEGRWRLEGVYVLRGCVELTLLLLRRGLGADEDPDEPRGVSLNVSSLLRALGLPLGGGEANDAGGGADHDDGAAAPRTPSPQPPPSPALRQRLLQRYDDDTTTTTTAASQVLSAWPRVVLLPSSSAPVATPPPPGGNDSTSPTRFPLTLRVVVDWGGGNTTAASSGGPGPSAAPPLASRKGAGCNQPSRKQPEPQPAGSSATSWASVRPAPTRPEGPPGDPGVKVLVRACNEYLPAQITSSNAVPGSGDLPSYKSDIELRDPPTRPGVLLVELFRGFEAADDDHSQHIALPLVATRDPGVASELTAASVGWSPSTRRQLDDLLYDMGAWIAFAGGGGGAAVGHGAGADPDSDLLYTPLRIHLLRHAEAMGLEHTAALLRTGGCGDDHHTGAAERPFSKSSVLPIAPVAANSAAAAAATDTASAALHSRRRHTAASSAAPTAAITAEVGCSTSSQRARSATRSADPSPFTAPVERWVAGMAETFQAVESALFLTQLVRDYRSGVPLFGPASAFVLMCLGVGLVSLLLWLTLPYNTWVWFAVHATLPRYALYITSKVLVATKLLPPSSVSVQYITGVGMLLYEGLILPGCCLLELPTAALEVALKTVTAAGILVSTGAVKSFASALLIVGRTAVLALATTAACHAYLRRQPQRARGVGNPDTAIATGARGEVGSSEGGSSAGGAAPVPRKDVKPC